MIGGAAVRQWLRRLLEHFSAYFSKMIFVSFCFFCTYTVPRMDRTHPFTSKYQLRVIKFLGAGPIFNWFYVCSFHTCDWPLEKLDRSNRSTTSKKQQQQGFVCCESGQVGSTCVNSSHYAWSCGQPATSFSFVLISLKYPGFWGVSHTHHQKQKRGENSSHRVKINDSSVPLLFYRHFKHYVWQQNDNPYWSSRFSCGSRINRGSASWWLWQPRSWYAVLRAKDWLHQWRQQVERGKRY